MNDDIHALSGAYAVDALDDVERARFERHLSGCSACQAEVASLREAAGQLTAITELDPPPTLRASVMADISRIRPLPPMAGSSEAHRPTSVTAAREAVAARGVDETSGPSEQAAQEAEAAEPERVPFLVRRRRLWNRLVAASAAALLAIGGFTVWRAGTYDPNQAAADEVLAAPDATRDTKRFPDGSTATVVRSDGLRKAVVITTDMADAPSGKVYQLWLQDSTGHMASAGLMPPGPDNIVVLSGDASSASGAGITIEPVGGSAQPTSDPIALFSFA